MGGIVRNPGNARFERNHEQAQRSARDQLRVIEANMRKLKSLELTDAAVSFCAMARRGDQFTPKQLSFIDGLYERCMKGAGLPSVNVHADRKRRGLRFG